LESDNGYTKLGVHIGGKGANDKRDAGLMPDGVSPNVMSESINEHSIVLKTRVTVNR
jgi:hypothetical protein